MQRVDADQIKLSFARLKAAELGASLPRAGRSVVRIGQERFGPALKHVKMARPLIGANLLM